MSTDDQSAIACEACDAGAAPVSDDALSAFCSAHQGWDVIEEDDVRLIRKTYTFPNFAKAMAFTNFVADIAENAGHHPTIVTEWGRVRIDWWSNKIKDLHALDLELARKCDGYSTGH